MLTVFQEALQKDTPLHYARLILVRSVLQIRKFVWQRNVKVSVFTCTDVTANVIVITMATSVSTSIVSIPFIASNTKSTSNNRSKQSHQKFQKQYNMIVFKEENMEM